MLTELLQVELTALQSVSDIMMKGEFAKVSFKPVTPLSNKLDTILKLYSQPKPLPQPIVKNETKEASLTFGELIANFNAVLSQRSPEVRAKDKAFQRVLEDFIGKKTPIKAINAILIRDKIKVTLDHLPVGYSQKREYRGLTASAVASIETSKPSAYRKLSATTKNDYLEHLIIEAWN